jgi:hypothetical protein
MDYTKSKIEILSSLLSFPTINQKNWESDFQSKPIEGDLVSMSSAPASKWYLSWVIEIKKESTNNEYLLKSIEDGSLCWWSNVGFNIYNREIVNERSTWKWSDQQFDFNTRWEKACKRNDAFIVLPASPKFNEDGSVILDVRIRLEMKDFSNPKTFPNWKKLTIKMMESYYLECVDLYHK